jgi:hypothetical protein
MARVTIEVDLPPDLTLIAYQRQGDGHGFEVSWPLPARCRCDHCRHDEPAHLEFKDTVQVVRDLDLWGLPSFWVYRPAYHRCPYCGHRQHVIPPFKRKDTSYTYCTRLDWQARQILSAYACRWAIEVTFENGKQFLGLEDPANRLPQAVRRTAPLALVLYSLVVAWFHRAGHGRLRFPDRPWYKKKVEPSFADLLSTLRRVSWEEKFPDVCLPSSPPQNLLAQLIDFVTRTA